jgi:DNA-binding transcriptional LysR family regulator
LRRIDADCALLLDKINAARPGSTSQFRTSVAACKRHLAGMDRFAGMSVFVKVVEGSSFAAAARQLRMSPAMVSKHVQTIEERLGVRLLNRTTRRVSPTEVGQSYYERCLRILSELAEAERAAADSNTTPRGLLKISAPFTFGIAHVAPAIAAYLAAHPDVSIALSLRDRFVDLLDEGFDLAIRIGQLPDSSLIARRLIAIQTILCASPTYLRQHGTPHRPRDLATHNCLVYASSASRGEWRFLDRHGTAETEQVSGRFTADNGDALRILALEGEGIVRVPIYIVDADLAAGRLVRVLADYEAAATPVSAVYPHSRFLSAKVRSFVDFLAAHLQRPPSDEPAALDAPARRVPAELRIA